MKYNAVASINPAMLSFVLDDTDGCPLPKPWEKIEKPKKSSEKPRKSMCTAGERPEAIASGLSNSEHQEGEILPHGRGI